MKKKITVLALLVAMCTYMFSSFGVYAAENDLYGRKINAGESVNLLTVKDLTASSGEIQHQDFQIGFINGSASYLGFTYFDGKNYGNYCYLFYSKESFSLDIVKKYSRFKNDELKSEYSETKKTLTSIYNEEANLYFLSIGESSGFSYDIQSGIPVYNIDFFERSSTILSQLANGTFEQENADDYIGGTEVPDFNMDTAEYVQDLGYLKNIHMVSGQRSDMSDIEDNLSGFERFIVTVVNGVVNTSYDPNLQRRVKFGQYSSTNFDLTKEGTYIRVYSTMTIWNSSMKEKIKSGERRYFDQFDATSLQFDFYHHKFMLVGQGDYTKIMSDPAFFIKASSHGYVRSDVFWFQICHWDGTKWQYGDYTKMTLNGDGTAESIAVTPDDDYIPDSEDTPTTSEGSGDSMDDIEDNSTVVTDSDSFTDFASILDGLAEGIGQFPTLVGKVFSFLPPAFIGMLVAGLAVIIVIRILGR